MKPFILASASPRRSEILKQCGLEFTVKVSDVDENIEASGPAELVEKLSYLKARTVADETAGEAVILGCDTVVACNGRIYGKPSDDEDAFRMLKTFSGGLNVVYSGIAVIVRDAGGTERYENYSVATKVYFRELTDVQIRRYIATGEPRDKAGAYAIQGRFAPYIERIEGDYYNIVGLPVCSLFESLERLGEPAL